MTTAIGASFYGFLAGGAIFLIQLLLFAVSQPSEKFGHIDLPEGITFLFYGSLVGALVIGLLFWVSSLFVVFPVYLIARLLQPSALFASVVSAIIAVLPCWWFLNSPGTGNNLTWPIYMNCLSSTAVTGAVTGFMLIWLMQKKENKAQMATPRKPSD